MDPIYLNISVTISELLMLEIVDGCFYCSDCEQDAEDDAQVQVSLAGKVSLFDHCVQVSGDGLDKQVDSNHAENSRYKYRNVSYACRDAEVPASSLLWVFDCELLRLEVSKGDFLLRLSRSLRER